MGNPRGVRRDFDALERRRFQAHDLLQQGFNQSEVARRVTVCPQTVSRWAAQVATMGKQSLKKAGRAGRKPLMSTTEQKRLVEKFYRCLNSGGYLFVGHAESLFGLTTKFRMMHQNNGTAYERLEETA